MLEKSVLIKLKGNALLNYITSQGESLSLYDVPVKILPPTVEGEKPWVIYEHNVREVMDAVVNSNGKRIDLYIIDKLEGTSYTFKNVLECKCSGLKQAMGVREDD